MMIGPAPMIRMVEISVRLGIGFLGSSREPVLTGPPSHEKRPLRDRNRPEGRLRLVCFRGAAARGRWRGDLKPRSLAENLMRRKGGSRPRIDSLFPYTKIL